MNRIQRNASPILACVVGCILLVLVDRAFPPGIGGLGSTLVFFLTILVASALGGWKAGATAVALGLLAAIFLFSRPYVTRIISDPVELLRLGTFGLLGVGLTVICELLRRAWLRIEERQRRLEKEVKERKQMEASLQQLAQSLSEADRRKDEFLATLADELRNPLAPIRSGLELLRLTQGVGRIFEQTRSMMERQLGQMIRLIDDLMDVGRINHGKLELRMENIELATVINNALEASRSVVETRKHELVLGLPRNPIFVYADPVRLSQVF